MALNTYFNNLGETGTNANEQQLISDWVVECIQINGINVKYLPRTEVKRDDLYGEDYLAAFNSAFIIEMYLESIDGFGGDNEALSAYGLTVDDTAEFRVATSRFIAETGMQQPMIGDLLYMPISNSLFEVKRIKDDDQFLPSGSQPSFIIVCEAFTQSMETFATGVAAIDSASSKDFVDSIVNPLDGENTIIQTESDKVAVFDENSPFGKF